jgi:hypothetical protein
MSNYLVTHDYWYLSLEKVLIFQSPFDEPVMFTDLPVPRRYTAFRGAREVHEFIDGHQVGSWLIDDGVRLPSDEIGYIYAEKVRELSQIAEQIHL